METRDAAVADYVPNAVINSLEGYKVRGAFEHLELDCAVAALVLRLGDYLCAKLARDVCVLTANFVRLFCAGEPLRNNHFPRVSALFTVGFHAFMLADLRPVAFNACGSPAFVFADFRPAAFNACGSPAFVFAD